MIPNSMSHHSSASTVRVARCHNTVNGERGRHNDESWHNSRDAEQNFVTSRVGPEIGSRGADTSTERGGVEGLVV